MMRTLTAVGATLGVLLTAPLASAQAKAGGAFGEQGQFIVSADRLFELFAFTRVSQDEFNPMPPITKVNDTATQTSFGLLWGGSSAPTLLGAEHMQSFYAVPRVGFDYTIIDNVTIGGELIAWFSLGGSVSTETDRMNGSSVTMSNDQPGTTILGIAPRGGYILALSDLFSVWLRGGFSFYTASQKSTIDNAGTKQTLSVQQFAIDLDPKLVITPIRHVGFTVGLTGDIPIGGGHSLETVPTSGASTNVSASSSVAFLGVTTGMLVWF
jgi:hypothetical protein